MTLLLRKPIKHTREVIGLSQTILIFHAGVHARGQLTQIPKCK